MDMACLICSCPLSTKRGVVVWLRDGTYRCWPCWR